MFRIAQRIVRRTSHQRREITNPNHTSPGWEKISGPTSKESLAPGLYLLMPLLHRHSKLRNGFLMVVQERVRERGRTHIRIAQEAQELKNHVTEQQETINQLKKEISRLKKKCDRHASHHRRPQHWHYIQIHFRSLLLIANLLDCYYVCVYIPW